MLSAEADVSIRVPLSRAGRRIADHLSPSAIMFQSASRSRERDDTKLKDAVKTSTVSIRVPLSRAGRHTDNSAQLYLHQCFNPRPALASGTTSPMKPPSLAVLVSIRVPLSRAGRPVDAVSTD